MKQKLKYIGSILVGLLVFFLLGYLVFCFAYC